MRTSMRLLNITLMLAAGLLLGETGQAEELSRKAMLSASCEGCHGTYGRSPGAIPSIAGKSAPTRERIYRRGDSPDLRVLFRTKVNDRKQQL
jgi:cytochrome c553